MLYTIFLYQSESGLLFYDKNFQDISDGKMELFSSFFSALKSFIGEMILDGEKELKNMRKQVEVNSRPRNHRTAL